MNLLTKNYDDFPYAQEYEDWDNYEEYQGLLEDDVTDEELEKDTITDEVFENGEISRTNVFCSSRCNWHKR
ncbi:hypothetical protein ACEQPO_11365 [Bacillus sp. SL00103]